MIIYGIDSADVIKRTYPLEKDQHSLVIGIFNRFSLLDQQQAQDPADSYMSIWELGQTYMPPDTLVDEGWPKLRGEFFVYGACYSQKEVGQQQPVSASIKVGDIQKRLAVFGERNFTALGVPSAAQPFSRVELSPQNAFGGDGFKPNPMGKGYSKDKAQASSLPNVELSDALIVSESDCPPPAGFWALAPDAPSRTCHLGQFDEGWRKTRWPHLPLDTQPDYFQAAPKDQQASRYFRGDEPLEIHNMHPHRALIQSQLPGVRCRLLVSGGDLEDAREYETRIDTVWVFPDALTGFVLHRCVIPVEQTDAADVAYALVTFERLGEPSVSFEQLRQRLADNVAQVSSQLEVESAVLVSSATDIELSQDTETDELFELDELEIDPSEPLDSSQLDAAIGEIDMPTLPPEFANLFGGAEMTQKSSLESLLAMKEEVQQTNAQFRQFLKDGVVNDPELIQALRSDPKTIDEANFLQSGPAGIEEMMTELEQEIDQLIQAERDNPSDEQEIDEAQELAAGLALADAEAAEVAEEPDLLTRQWVIQEHGAGKSFNGYDLSGLDLSDLDLRDADFQNAILSEVNFSKSILTGAIFEGAVINTANFESCDLSQTNYRRVSAEFANFKAANLQQASLREADFTGADFSDADMTLADLKTSIFSKAKLVRANAVKAIADSIECDSADCSEANFQQARMPEANFYGATLVQASFMSANCKKADFSGVNAARSQFQNAELIGTQADFQSDFENAIFDQANMKGINWNKARIVNGRFDKANLCDGDMTGCMLAGARFVAAESKGLCLDRCDLSEADMSGMNCLEGSMRNANLRQAKAVGANLFGVDFLDSNRDGFDYQGSLVGQTILEFRRS